MFNFKLFENVLLDRNLSDKDKVLASFLMKRISMSKSGEVEMYVSYLADALNCSDSAIKRSLKKLSESGYISKRIGKRNGNNKPISIRLNDEKSMPQVTLSYEKSRSQVILTSESRGQNQQKVEVTGDLLKNSILNNISMYKGKDSGNETIHVPGNGKSEVDTVSVEGTITDDVHSDEVRETSPREKLTKAEIEERNNYITSTFSRLETKLNYLYSISDSRIFGDVSMSIADIFNDATGKRRWFTDKQWGKLLRYGDRYEKIVDGKQAYFNGTGKKNADAELTSTDEKPFNEEPEKNTTDNDTDNCGGVAPQQYKRMTKEELEAWVSEDVKKYPDFTSWQNALEAKLDRKFKGWQEGKHLYISCMYNFVTGMAAKHFNRLEIEKRAEKYSQPASKPYGEINEGTGVLAENGTEPHSRFLRAFLPIGGIVGYPE